MSFEGRDTAEQAPRVDVTTNWRKMSHTEFHECPLCLQEGTVAPVDGRGTRVLNGETFEVPTRHFVCSNCKHEFLPMAGDIGLLNAREQYRAKHEGAAPPNGARIA